MSLTSRFGISLTFGLLLSLSTPFIIPAISHNSRFTTAQAQPQPTTFSDIPADYWASDYITGLTKLNIISGFGDGTFRPNDPVTRAQFAAILRQAFLTSQPTTDQAFKDVPAGYWATDAIASARSAGFLSGYPDNTFKPNDRILRVQALISLANGLKYPTGNPQSLSNYKDADTVPAYAQPSIATAAQANLIVSYPAPNQISPNRSTSRAEVAAFVYQALVKAGLVDPIAAKPEERWQMTPTTTITALADQVSISGNGQRLAATTDRDLNPKVQVWNTQTGSLLRTITAEKPYRGFSTIAISEDGTKIAFMKRLSSTDEQQLTVQAVEDGNVLLTQSLTPPKNQILKTDYLVDPGMSPSKVSFSPDGKQVITQVSIIDGMSGTLYNRLDFRDIATGKVTQSINLVNVYERVFKDYIVSHDGNLLAILSSDYIFNSSSTFGTIPSFRVRTRTDLWRRNPDNRFDYWKTLPIAQDASIVLDVAFTASNLLNLITTNSLSNLPVENPGQTLLETWNPQTAERVSSTALPTETCVRPDGVVFSPDGTSYYSSYPDAGTCLGNVQSGEFQKLPNQPFAYGIVGFSSDGNRLAISDMSRYANSTVQIFSKSKN